MAATNNPFDEIDFGLMLLTAMAPPHWPWAALLAAEFVTRRSPRAAAYVLDALGWEADEAPAWLLPGAQKLLAMPESERPKATPFTMPNLIRKRRGTPMPELAAALTQEPAPAAPAAPAAATQRQARAPQVAERPRWVEIVNDHPDAHPHALIVGGTGAGKTTMAKAIIGDRGGQTIVLAPKVSPKGWVNSGAEVISLDDDCTYAPISRALQDIDEEKRKRSRMVKEGKVPRPMTIVLDDIQDLVVAEPAAGQLMVNLSSIGRELNMRLIGIGTTDDALNVRGWKASRNNYVRIDTDATRRGTLNDGTRTINIQAQESKQLADAAKLQPWRQTAVQMPLPGETPHQEIVTAPSDLLATLMADVPAEVREAVPAISPERAARLARIMAGQQAQSAVKVEHHNGDVYVFAGAKADATAPQATEAVTKTTKQPRRRGESVVNLQDRRRRLERKAYYEQAARDGVALQRAYDARPKGEKGDFNEAGNWYRAEKTRIKAS